MRFPWIDYAILHPVIHNECPVNGFNAELETDSISIRIDPGDKFACVHLKIPPYLGLYKLRHLIKPSFRSALQRMIVRAIVHRIGAITEEVR